MNHATDDAGMKFTILSDKEMLQIIWDMGLKAEKEGMEIDQLLRFQTISKAQLTHTLKEVVKWCSNLCLNPAHSYYHSSRKDCLECWLELKDKAGVK